MEVKGFVKDCRSCEDFMKATAIGSLKPVRWGQITIKEQVYTWVVVESRSKAAEHHFIFTICSHHVGAEEQEVRAVLNGEATRVAFELVGSNYRLDNNSGTAATLSHYHTHIISPSEGERLPRIVANVAKVVQKEFPESFPAAATGAMVQFLDDALLQKPK